MQRRELVQLSCEPQPQSLTLVDKSPLPYKLQIGEREDSNCCGWPLDDGLTLEAVSMCHQGRFTRVCVRRQRRDRHNDVVYSIYMDNVLSQQVAMDIKRRPPLRGRHIESTKLSSVWNRFYSVRL